MLGGTEGVGAQHAAPLRFSVSAPLLFLVHIPHPCTGPIAYDRLRMTDLKRSLRLADGLAMVVGMTVGAGIFRTPGIVPRDLAAPGSPSWCGCWARRWRSSARSASPSSPRASHAPPA